MFSQNSMGRFILAAVLFFLSGALGLGYELVWIRKAALLVGASQIALATVLTSFFLGLGLGSLFVGRYLRSDRVSPLFAYGLFEAGIGIFALSFPVLFKLMEFAYGGLYPFFEGSVIALFFLRFILLFLLFLPPTFLMGGTLPLLLDGLVEKDGAIGSLTSFLYGLNILGAVTGVLLTGYFLIPVVGMNSTSLYCGLGNISIAIVALSLFRGLRPLHPPPAKGPGRFFTVLAFFSGMAAIGYQVAWARYFSLFNVSSVYLTAILLAVFLAALATGSMILVPILTRRVSALRIIAFTQGLVPLLAFHSFDWWRAAHYAFTGTSLSLTGETAPSWYFMSETADSIFFAPLFQIALVIFLPVVLLGTALPALITASTRKSENLRSHSGALIFWNTLGSSAGGFAAGYLLIPWLGLGGAFFCLGLFSVTMAVSAEFRFGSISTSPGTSPLVRRLFRPGYVLGAIALASGISLLGDDVTRRTILASDLVKGKKDAHLGEINEGPLTTAYVLKGKNSQYIAAGSVILAKVEYDKPAIQAIQGHIPALFYPGPGVPRRCLGIALGSGQSFGALLNYSVEKFDVVDISNEMVKLSLKHFGDFNHGLGEDERVTIHLDDGRHFVDRAPDASYDVITMEPPPPTADGVFSLYSMEFYKSVKRVLREQGVFMQWLPLYMVTPEDLKGMLKTQAAVFPYTFVVRMGSIDFMVVSLNVESLPRFDVRWIVERIKTFALERMVGSSHWEGTEYMMASTVGVISMLITGPEDIALMKTSVSHHDDDQGLSYTSGDRELLRRYYNDGMTASRLSFSALPVTPFRDLQKYFIQKIPVSILEEERARTLSNFGVASPGLLDELTGKFRDSDDPERKARLALTLAKLYDTSLRKAQALEWVSKALEAKPDEGAEESIGVAKWIARNQIANYHEMIEKWVGSIPEKRRETPLVRAISGELRAYSLREDERQAAYLFSK